jgi:hypothetical protein
MKVFFIFIVSSFICLNLFARQEDMGEVISNRIKEKDSVFCTLKIIKITKIEKAYVIDAYDTKENYLYKIVSLKNKIKKCPRIKVGKELEFILLPYFNLQNEIPNENIKMVIEINGVRLLIQSDSWSSNVYTTPNLIGLFYVSFP